MGVPLTTPTFSGTPVPGVPTDQQPPTSAAAPIADKTKQMLAALLQAASRKQVAPTAVPARIPQAGDAEGARNIGMNTGWPSAWGKERLMAGIAASIKSGVAKQKEDQLLKAEGDWTYLQSGLNELYAAQQNGDQAGAAAAQKKIDVVMNDPKKLKQMAKALNQDWLNPEKTTVYGEALKRVSANQGQQDQKNQQKQQAAQGLKGLFQKLLGQKQAAERQAAYASMSPEEKARMAREIQERAPTATGMDKESVAAFREAQREEARLAEEKQKEEARAKEQEQKETWQREELVMKDRMQRHRDETQNAFHERMQNLQVFAAQERQNQHDLAMMEALNMRLTAEQKKMFTKSPKEIESEINGTVTSLRQQLAQSEQKVRSLRSQASSHWMMGPGKSEIEDAEANSQSLRSAVEYLEKNRDAVVKGKKDMGEVVSKAYDLMGGGGQEVPGFKPDK